MKAPRLWALVTVAAGLAVMGVSAWMAMLPQAAAAGACLKDDSLIQFELARNSAELVNVFGPFRGACRAPMMSYVDAVNTLDLFAFIPAYTLFCCCAAGFLGGGFSKPLAVAAFAAALVAAAGDLLETRTLLALSHSLQRPDALIPRVLSGAWTKFIALAVHAALIAAICFTEKPKRWIVGALALVPVPATLLMIADQHAYGRYITLAFTIAWAVMFLAAVKSAIWPPKAGA